MVNGINPKSDRVSGAIQKGLAAQLVVRLITSIYIITFVISSANEKCNANFLI
jgi:hypothetical protein